MTSRRRPRLASAAALAVALFAGTPAAAQQRPPLWVSGPDEGGRRALDVGWHRGYAAVPAGALADLGWSVRASADGVRASSGDVVVELRAGQPLFRWGDEILQLVDEPYRFGDDVWVPLQLLTDFLPSRLRDAYAFGGEPPTLRVLDPARWRGASAAPAPGRTPPVDAPASAGPPPSAARPRDPEPAGAPDARERAAASNRVVVIDPGHGGRDPGARGPGGTREKDVALAIGLALAEELRSRPGLEVHLTRDDDRLVPIWQRGQWATDVKGTRPGVFVSLHANAVSRRDARGFETYFLSDARTDHERRVAALENAPLDLDRREDVAVEEPELDFILKELRNFDHPHWSSLLASLVQERLAPVHPGPDRGVKQAPLAVITNALMPAVLVEVGFITNREEERVIARPSFHEDAARAVADAIEDFFQRYPPGSAATGGERR